jgi:hypothetical protein
MVLCALGANAAAVAFGVVSGRGHRGELLAFVTKVCAGCGCGGACLGMGVRVRVRGVWVWRGMLGHGACLGCGASAPLCACTAGALLLAAHQRLCGVRA